MNLSKIAAAVGGVALVTSLAACGSSTKNTEKAAGGAGSGGSVAGSLVGVTMPTRSATPSCWRARAGSRNMATPPSLKNGSG